MVLCPGTLKLQKIMEPKIRPSVVQEPHVSEPPKELVKNIYFFSHTHSESNSQRI